MGITMAYHPKSAAAKAGGFKIKRNTKGFTMVELLVTLAITAVLAGIVTLSLMAYTDYANFKRQNEYAQSLFVAAQNALTHYSENGELEPMNSTMERYAKGKTLRSDMLEGEAYDKFIDAKYENRIYYITVNKDGTVYGGPAGESQRVKEVFDRIFAPYVYDKSILSDASVTIEFDPVGGVVYSVLYSDMKEGFVYGTAGEDGYVSVSNRDYDTRKKRMLGYYGIDELSDETSRAKEKPVIETVKLVNGNSLDLQFRLTDKYARKATNDLTYTVQLYNAESNRLMMDFAVKGFKALYQDPDGTKLGLDALTVLADVKTYKPDGTENGVLKDVQFTAYADNTNTLHLYLDSVDLAAAPALDASAAEGTYSFRRFGLDTLWKDYTGNLYAKVQAAGGRYKPSSVKRSVNTENAYFASEKRDQNSTSEAHSYSLKNARHLYNVRFTEEKTAETGKTLTNSYTVAGSFAWGGENGLFAGENGSEVFSARVQQEETADAEKTAFPAVAELKKGDSFTSASNEYVISRLVLRGSGTGLGLFVKNSGSITNVTMEDADVEGGDSVGTFCGINAGTLEGLTTLGGTVSGKSNVGGVAGSDSRLGSVLAPEIVYRNNENGSSVAGSRYVGGIVGQLASSPSQSVTMENCRNTGLVMGKLGSDEDPTKKLRDDLVGKLIDTAEKYAESDPKYYINVESSGYDDTNRYKNNMFAQFESLNGGYPALSEYDTQVAAKIIEQTKGVHGSSGTWQEQAENLCKNLIWAPCAVAVPGGSIKVYNNKNQLTGEYEIALEAKPLSTATSGWNSWFVYLDGTYYYSVHGSSKKLNARSFMNKGKVDQLVASSDWIAYTPEINSGSANHPDEGVTTLENEPAYIGGIIGYADASKTGSSGFVIKDCVSTPDTDNAESLITALLEEDARWESFVDGTVPLLGVYVGGVAGYSDGASIKNCSTQGGYVVGSNYVGGIVGLEQNSTIESSVNNADVIGKYYVGGIVGANTDLSGKDENGFVLPKSGAVSGGTLSGWLNRGMVVATRMYGGGVTGYNTGTLSNCAIEVNPGQFMTDIAKKYGGSHMGGIAGYNLGSVVSQKNMDIIPTVYGKDYVGGVIGYNDYAAGESMSVYGYSCTGGFVEGEDFVGGYMGLNLSPRAFLGKDGAPAAITANLNRVKGQYYVGGAIGGNMVSGQAASGGDIKLSFSVDNFLGTVEAAAFAGGYMGFNMAAESTEAAKNYVKEMTDYPDDAKYRAQRLESDVYKADASAAMRIDGGGARLQGVTAQVYAGGVLGFNNPGTAVTISNVVNETPVTASDSIVVSELEQARDLSADKMDFDVDAYTREKKTYSYAGGIVGKVTKNMTIDSCSSSDAGRVTASGTYLGGLAEVNEGLLKNCRAVNLGNSSRNYVGGLVGLNKWDGRVENGLPDGKTVIGANVAGGLAAENFGAISQSEFREVSGTVYGYGENIGGLAGISRGGFSVDGAERSASVSGYLRLRVTVGGTGFNVGGAVGFNSGKAADLTIENGDVTGAANTGGLIGNQQGGSLSGLNNYFTPVTGSYGYAGGVVGRYDGGDKGVLMNGTNFADVKLLGERTGYESFAGGIAGGVLSGTMDYCENQTGRVIANQGGAGGVAGINYGTIRNMSNSNASEVKGRLYVGGVAAVNHGSINGSQSGKGVRTFEISDFSGAQDGYLGGIAGLNDGSITDCQVEGVTLISNSVNTKTGGVAGLNSSSGSIKGSADIGVYGVTIKFAKNDLSYYGYMGGVAGVNSGSISGYKVGNSGMLGNTRIYGSANNPEKPPKYDPNYDYEKDGALIYGYGGIAGLNGSTEPGEPSDATIENCVVAGLELTATGDSYNIANIGGVAGVNSTEALISGISFVNRGVYDTTITTQGNKSSYVYAGGAVGYNNGGVYGVNYTRAEGFGDGSTEDSESARARSKENDSKVEIHINKGQVGGIVGLNKQSGTVARCATGQDWSLQVDARGQDNGLGGIIGYNSSANPITDCDNWATVYKGTLNGQGKFSAVKDSVGGIIGRNEVVSGSWYLENCNNFGDLRGIRVGGMIGCQKYNGGTLLNCSNYGKVEAVSEGAGGMIGMIYDVTKNSVFNITSCKNYGEIAGGGDAAAGILGLTADRCRFIRVVVSDCVNTGYISSSATLTAGIVAKYNLEQSPEGSDGKTLVINNCRNYGLPKNPGNFSGITQAEKLWRATVRNCVGVAGRTDAGTQAVIRPISKDSDSNKNNNNYYFIQSKGTSVSGAGLGTPLYLEENGGAYTAYDMSGNPVFKDLILKSGYSKMMGDASTGLTVLGGSNNLRQSAYLNMDGKLTAGSYDVPTPTGLKPADSGRSVSLTWAAEGNPYKFEVEVTADGETKTYTAFDKSFVLSTAGLEGKTVRFRVYSVSPLGERSEGYAEESYSVPAKTLPAPKIRLVLSSLTQQNYYRVVVDNAGEYANFGEVNVVVASQNGNRFSEITVRIQDGSVMNPDEAGFNNKDGGGGNTNYMITSQAVKAEGNPADIGKSSIVTRETMVPNTGDWESGTKMGKPSVNGFTGTTPGTLSYNLSIQGDSGNGYAAFFRSELLAVDPDGLGVPVVYSYGDVSVVPDTTSKAQLNNLPADLGHRGAYQNVTVRSYPISMANQMVYTGFEVGRGYSEADLKALHVSGDGKIIDSSLDADLLIQGGVKKNGYVIYKNGDTYSLWFNALIKASEGDALVDGYSTQVQSFLNLDKKDDYPGYSDAMDVNASYDDGAQKFTASWQRVKGGVYNYTLTGETRDGAFDTFKEGTVTASADGAITMEESTVSWRYKNVTLRVEKLGKESGGKTTEFGASSEITVAARLKLSTVPVPYAALKDNYGLVYNVSWSGITDPTELTYLDGYQVILESDLQTENGPKGVTAVYKAGPGDTSVELDLNNVTGADADGNPCTGYIGGNTPVKIRVIAVAKAGQEEYGNSADEGMVFKFTLPKRLETPLTDGLTVNSAVDGLDLTAPVSIENFESEGFKITYQDSSDYNAQFAGKFQLAAEIYSNDGKTRIAEIASKEAPLTLSGNKLSEAAAYVLTKNDGFTSLYAGQKLRLHVRAVSNNSIASLWSDYFDVQLPQVKVDPVDAKTVHSVEDTEAKVYQNDVDTLLTRIVSQDRFSWANGRYTKGYEVLLTRIGDSAGKDYKKIVDRLSVVNGSSYDEAPTVTFVDVEDPDITTAVGKVLKPEIQKEEAYTTYTYDLGAVREEITDSSGAPVDSFELELGYSLAVKVYSDGKPVNGVPGIKSIEYTLTLPDAKIPAYDDIGGSVARAAYHYNEISITASADQGRSIFFVNSDPAVLKREPEKTGDFKAVTDVSKAKILYAKQMSYYVLEQNEISERETAATDPIRVTPIIIVTPTPENTPGDTPAPDVTPSPTPEASPTPGVTPSPTPEASPTPGVTPSPTPGASPTPGVTPSPAPEASPTPEPSAEPTPQPTPEPTPEPTAEPTPEPTAEPEPPPEENAGNTPPTEAARNFGERGGWD